MTPVPLPTDNLYKFCAITGLVMIGVSLYASWQITFALEKEWREARLARSTERLEAKYISESIDRVVRTTSELKNPQTDEATRAEGKIPVRISPEEVIAEVSALREANKRVALKVMETDAKEEAVGSIIMQRIVIRWVGAAFIVGGGVMSTYGFRNWRRLQLIQDELLEKQSRQ